jgi:rod shape-determining protein MreB
MRTNYGLLVGETPAEEIKIQIGSVWPDSPEKEMVAKGRDLASGLPGKVTVTRSELVPALGEVAASILGAAQSVLERTPPELVGDIRTGGIVMTGGGSLLNGLDAFIAKGAKVKTRIAENPVECVAIGTAKSFAYLGELFDGFLECSHSH